VATAKRLYLYSVSAVGLSMLIAGAIVLLRELFNKVGFGPALGGWAAERDMISIAVAIGAVGAVVWLIHWMIVERMVRPSGAAAPEAAEAAAAERRSIVRSIFFAVAMAIVLSAAVSLAVDLVGRVIADALKAPSGSSMSISLTTLSPFGAIDKAWSLSIVVVLLATWAYHAWVRARDVHQGPVINGAAAWISRFYLYYIAFVGLMSVLSAVASLVTTVLYEWAKPSSVNTYGWSMGNESGTATWVRPVVIALVGIVAWGAVWLSHWLWSTRLRSGTSDQSAAERTSRVRVAFFMSVLFYGAVAIVSGFSSGLNSLLNSGFSLDKGQLMPLWYLALAPVVAVLPAGLAWWWHRRKALAESPEGPVGVSVQRIGGYLVALVGLTALTFGIGQALATLFKEWFSEKVASTSFYSVSDDSWKIALLAGVALAVVGLAVWIWPWISAQRRAAATAAERAVELASSARAYFLYVVLGAAVVIGAVGLAEVLYRYLRLILGLPEKSLGTEVSGPIAVVLVTATVVAYHYFLVLRKDRAKPAPVAPAASPASSK
jgi:hypothetical protein